MRLPNLVNVSFNDCILTKENLRSIESCKQLESICMEFVRGANGLDFTNLTNLIGLDVRFTYLENIDTIVACQKLRCVYLLHVQVEDFSPLGKCLNLEYILAVRDHREAKYETSKLPKLRWLYTKHVDHFTWRECDDYTKYPLLNVEA